MFRKLLSSSPTSRAALQQTNGSVGPNQQPQVVLQQQRNLSPRQFHVQPQNQATSINACTRQIDINPSFLQRDKVHKFTPASVASPPPPPPASFGKSKHPGGLVTFKEVQSANRPTTKIVSPREEMRMQQKDSISRVAPFPSEEPTDIDHDDAGPRTIEVKPLPKIRLSLMPAPREEDEENSSSESDSPDRSKPRKKSTSDSKKRTKNRRSRRRREGRAP